MKGLLTHDCSFFRWLISSLLITLALLASLWLIGLNPPLPKFKLDEADRGSIKPVDWPWWRQGADWLHGRKYLMLTFDDGPADHETNMRILHILAKHHAHAVFFSVCRNADLPGRGDDLRQAIYSGNLIGNHSYTHPKLPQLNATNLRHQIEDCKEDLERITGKPVHWFRPPFGLLSDSVLNELKRDGLKDVLWDANSEDSWQRKPAQILHWSVTQASNNSILLMHSHATTAAALDQVLTVLEKNGYKFVLAQGGM